MCPSGSTRTCLQINVRNGKLYFSFWLPDVYGKSMIPLNQWIHTAFVYDITAPSMIIYVNGIVDAYVNSTNSLLAQTGNFFIGTNPYISVSQNYFQVRLKNI